MKPHAGFGERPGERARGNRRTAPQADLTPVTPYPRVGCPAVNIQSGCGDGTQPSPISPQPNWAVLRISDGSACRLIGDALDLRHRLTTIWGAALSGQVPAYQARRIAAATRHLTAEQAGWVDAELAPSWVRCRGAVADPAGRRDHRG